MIRIRIRAPIAGEHGTHSADSVVHFPPHVARQIIDARMGTLVDHPDEVAAGDDAPDFEEVASSDPAPGRPATPPRKRGKRATEAVPEWTAE